MAITRVRCPTCRKEVSWADNPHRPFCSERCRVLDLGAWAAEKYRIPGAAADEPDAEEEGEEDPPTYH